MKEKLMVVLITKIIELLCKEMEEKAPEVLRSIGVRVVSATKEAVKKSNNKVDDMVVLPLLESLEIVLGD